MEALRARAELLSTVRDFFRQRGVMETQTPVLGAATVTEPAVESVPVPGLGYLRTSPEYHLKRLLAAGAPSLFEIGPVFRAGESGHRHNPEFVMLEWYRLGHDDRQLMAEVAELVDRVLGPADFRTVSYREVAGLAPTPVVEGELDLREVQDFAISAGLEVLGPGRFFVVDYPADQAALARLRPGDPDSAARFELVVDGLELVNGYWELGDRDALEARFRADLDVRRARGQHQPGLDSRFLDAMAAGLPACAGVALGFDRLLMLKMGASTLGEVMPFPAERA